MVEKASYPRKETVAVDGNCNNIYRVPEGTHNSTTVTVRTGRHVVDNGTKGNGVVCFWEAARLGRQLFDYDEEGADSKEGIDYEEEDEDPAYAPPSRAWLKDRLAGEVSINDGEMNALQGALERIYAADFDMEEFGNNLENYIGANIGKLFSGALARDILRLAAAMTYEDLSFEEDPDDHKRYFTSFDRADKLLEIAIPIDMADYKLTKMGMKNVIEEAKTLFMKVHPAARELCEKCVTDKKALIDAERREAARRSVTFEESLPPELKETLGKLKKISAQTGAFICHPFSMHNALPEPVNFKTKDGYATYVPPGPVPEWSTPAASEMPTLQKRERELKAEVSLLLQKHGIKGTVWPAVDAPS